MNIDELIPAGMDKIKKTTQIYQTMADPRHLYMNNSIEGLPSRLTENEPAMQIDERKILDYQAHLNHKANLRELRDKRETFFEIQKRHGNRQVLTITKVKHPLENEGFYVPSVV